jgi:hypothetical protein
MTNEYLIAEFEHITLKWKIRLDSISQKWSTAVKDTLEAKGNPSRVDAKYWLSDDDELEFHYQNLVNSMTDLKNNIDEMPGIPGKKSLNQYILNNIHDWFAKNETTSELLATMHHHLHSLERCYKGNPPTIQVGWSQTPRFQFEESDYLNFIEERKFGEIELTYCHIGKDPHNIFLSKDDLRDDVFVPYTHYSADFVAWFGIEFGKGDNTDFWKWFDDNYQWFQSRTGWAPRDPRIAVGRYKVADIVLDDFSQKEVVSMIQKNTKILNLIIL